MNLDRKRLCEGWGEMPRICPVCLGEIEPTPNNVWAGRCKCGVRMVEGEAGWAAYGYKEATT